MAAAPFFFFLFATVAIAAALGMLIARNPVTSALWLVLNMFCIAGLYITMNATFIGVIQILVYAGAIMVLFLFVIMLLNLSAVPRLREIDWTKVAAFALGMVILAQLLYVVAINFDVPIEPVAPAQAAEVGDASTLAKSLFTRYALHLEVTALLLLAATIGAVMLAQRRFE
jgi:NADH-quinone oxidoreductase subunit J